MNVKSLPYRIYFYVVDLGEFHNSYTEYENLISCKMAFIGRGGRYFVSMPLESKTLLGLWFGL